MSNLNKYLLGEASNINNFNLDKFSSNTDGKIDQLSKQIKYTFGVFADYHFDKETAKYLKNHLSIKILVRVEDKWENGEVYYWFQHADNYLIF